MITKPMHVSVP